MSKDAIKTLQVIISEECWEELAVLRIREKKKTIQEVIRNILEDYTTKLIRKNNKDIPI